MVLSFSGGKDVFFTFYVETEKMSLQDLWSRTPVLRLFTYFEEDTLKSLFFVKWRVLKSLPPSTEQENSCLLASASCEQLHRQTPSLQLSSSVLIFTLANPYTKQNSFNCRWWASEREWTPAFLAAKNLFGICHTDEQFEFSSSICLTTIMACWAFLKYSCLPLTRNFVMALRRYPMQSVFSSCFVPGLLLWVSTVSTSGLGSGEHSIPAVLVRTTKLEW